MSFQEWELIVRRSLVCGCLFKLSLKYDMSIYNDKVGGAGSWVVTRSLTDLLMIHLLPTIPQAHAEHRIQVKTTLICQNWFHRLLSYSLTLIHIFDIYSKFINGDGRTILVRYNQKTLIIYGTAYIMYIWNNNDQ